MQQAITTQALTPVPASALVIATPTKTTPSSKLTIPASLPSSAYSSPLSSADVSDSEISDDDHADDVFQEAEEYSGDLPTPSTKLASAAVLTTEPVTVVPLPETHIEPVQVLGTNGVTEGVRGLLLSSGGSSNSISSSVMSTDESSVSHLEGGHSRRNSDSSQLPLLPSRGASAPSTNSSPSDTLQPPSASSVSHRHHVATTPNLAISTDSPSASVISTTATTHPVLPAQQTSVPPTQLRRQLTMEMLESPQHQHTLTQVTPPTSAPPSPQRTAHARSTLGLFNRLFHSLTPSAPASPSHTAHAAEHDSTSQHAQHPSIRVKSKKKSSVSVLTGVHETQRLDNEHVGPIWAITIASDGSYIATGGQDSVLRLWELSAVSPHLAATPISLSGHKSDIIDLSFSPSHFILSASIDHTVRLWHPSKHAALSVFQHPDFVTAVHFNPLDERSFATACFDHKVRVWSILDHRVTEWSKVSELCTACRYDRTGRYVLVGTHVGTVSVIRATADTGGSGHGGTLKYVQELNCRNRSGKHKKGKKVTGIDFHGHLCVVTTNDSRLRIFDMNDHTDVFTLVCKLKGVRNESLQIKGKFNDDGTLVVCGSDDGHIAVWQVPPQILQPASRRMQVQGTHSTQHDERADVIKVAAREQFHAVTGSVATCAQFLPRKFFMGNGSGGGAVEAAGHVIVAASSGGEIKVFEDRRS